MQWISIKQFLLQSGLSAEACILSGIFAIGLVLLFAPRMAYGIGFWISLFVLLGAFYFSGFTPDEGVFLGFRFGAYTVYLKRFFIISASIGLFGFFEWRQGRNLDLRPEIFIVLLLSLLGLNLLIQSESFWLIFFAAELFSICSYVLAKPVEKSPKGVESVLTYFGIGALASAIGLFGLSWVMGFQGLPDSEALLGLSSLSIFPWIGTILFLSFLIFKLGGFPFHFWVPKVFENAPTPWVGYISVAPKVAGAFAFLHIVQQVSVDITLPICILVAIGATLGNLSALRSESLKNMFAFSSIAQSAFLLVPAIVGSRIPHVEIQLLIFAVAYGVANQGLFCGLQYFENHMGDKLKPEHLAGQLLLHPLPSIGLIILLLSVIGFPPTIGFTGKLLLISTLVPGSGLWPGSISAFLFGLLAINTLLSMAYYYKIPFQFIFKTKSLEFTTMRSSAATLFWIVFTSFFVLMAFIKPALFFPFP